MTVIVRKTLSINDKYAQIHIYTQCDCGRQGSTLITVPVTNLRFRCIDCKAEMGVINLQD